MKGIYMSLRPGDVKAYSVVVDAGGREASHGPHLGRSHQDERIPSTFMYPVPTTPGAVTPAPTIGNGYPPCTGGR